VDIKGVNEREQDGYTGDAAQAGQDAYDRAGQDARQEHAQMRNTCESFQGD
jgi:hypothetical protein